jgi:phage shock protein PspC (stress-responsive transcriptional regulator)
MDKTIKINLGGVLFQIDEDAFKVLRQYLNGIEAKLRYTKGSAETIEDIEARMAEIFQAQQGITGIITMENVNAMISIIGRPDDFDVSDEINEESEYRSGSTVPKKLYRNPNDSIIGGVCGGIGAYLNMESVWVRLLFILFACFFGIGFFVYVALWIALPYAKSDAQKREMYGTSNLSSVSPRKRTYAPEQGYQTYSSTGGSAAGNAINEVFRAIGKVLFIILRVFLIIIGVTFVVSAFALLITTIMIFFFKYPGYFSTHSYGIDLFYLPDFLNFIVNPSMAPWILVLAFIVILLPLLALIYWGVKMIFWFRAKDGIVSLVALVVWVVSLAALSLILFNEGISFAETASSTSGNVIEKPPHELYIISGNRVADLKYDEEISLPDDDYNVYLEKDDRTLYITSDLELFYSENSSLKLDVRKSSSGRSRPDAVNKAGQLIYNYRMSRDTLFLDEYFTIPPGNKWSVDKVIVRLYIPEGTVIHFDSTTRNMMDHYGYHSLDIEAENEDYDHNDLDWKMTDHGLRRISDSDN